MVNTGVLYAITAGVGGLTIGVVLNRLLATVHKEIVDYKLVNLLSFFIAFCTIDMIWGLLSSRLFINNVLVYSVFTYGFHSFAAISAFLWAGYVIHYLKVSEKNVVILNIVRVIFLTIQITVLVSNIWNHRFFDIDSNANYHSYQLRNFMFFMQFGYYIALIVYCLAKMPYTIISGDKDRRKHYMTALVFSCVPLGFGFGQMLWPDASMYSLGFMLTSILIYSYNITSEREDILGKIYETENNRLANMVTGLSGDYVFISYINLDTNEYENYGDDEDFEGYIFGDVESSNDFFEDIRKVIDRAVVEEDRDFADSMFRKGRIISELSKNPSFSFNYRMNLGGEERYYLAKAIRPAVESSNDEGNYVIIGIFDDDARIRGEMEQSQKLREALETAEKASKAKTDFLFNMSHDIRTPMNAIIGFTSLAKKHYDDEKYLLECLDKVSISGDHLLSLINDVLDMSRIESGKIEFDMKPESLKRKNDQLVAIARELATSKSIEFVSEYKNVIDDCIICDALHLNQVLLNILSNAVKYTHPGGNVHYLVEQLESNQGKAKYRFVVSDNGIGMSKEFLEKIYDEFEREHNATMSGVEGTGLGMSIVKKLVDYFGGNIIIESEKDKGTTVECILSFDISEGCIVENDGLEKAKYYIPEGKRVLLVDDNALNREIAHDILDELGVDVDEAWDGADAVEKISKSTAGYYSLVFMDVQMPGMNGYEATQKIRANENEALSSIPIVAMTANAFDEDKKDALSAGMNDHLAKPIDIKKLVEVLNKYL